MKTLIAIPAWILALGGLGSGKYFVSQMRYAVNAKLAPKDRYSSFINYSGKSFMIIARYRELYPDGELARYYWRSVMAGIVGFASLAFIFS